jgi:hypothetical protein
MRQLAAKSGPVQKLTNLGGVVLKKLLANNREISRKTK